MLVCFVDAVRRTLLPIFDILVILLLLGLAHFGGAGQSSLLVVSQGEWGDTGGSWSLCTKEAGACEGGKWSEKAK